MDLRLYFFSSGKLIIPLYSVGTAGMNVALYLSIASRIVFGSGLGIRTSRVSVKNRDVHCGGHAEGMKKRQAPDHDFAPWVEVRKPCVGLLNVAR